MRLGMDIETQDNKVWCVGIADLDGKTATKNWEPILDKIVESGDIPIFHNSKYDLSFLDPDHTKLPAWEDTIILAHLLGYRPLNLSSLTQTFFGVELNKEFVKESMAKGKKKVTFDDRPQETLEGCSLDAWATRTLYSKFAEQAKPWADLYEKEKKITAVLMDMEATGLPVSQEKLKAAKRHILRLMGQQEQILSAYGIDEPGDRKYVGQKFWRHKRTVITTKKGALSTKGADLKKYATPEERPWVDAFVFWHQLAKFMSTYITAWEGKDWVHHTLNQTGTQTWRFSCSDPNLQNVTKSKIIPLFQLFVAPPGWTFISGDYKQLELRVLANMAQDRPLIDLFLANGDPHQDTIDRLTLEDKFPGDYDKARTFAKTLNFGIPYGMGGYSYAKRLDMEKTIVDRHGREKTVYDAETGQEFIDGWYEQHPDVSRWQQEQVAFAKETGYVETFLGRPLWAHGIHAEHGTLYDHAERQCYNFPIQGGAAEVVKDAMLKCPKYLVNQVHDELLYLVPEAEAEEYRQHLREQLQDYRHTVPYTIDFKIGKTWGNLKNLEDIWTEESEDDDEEE